jgi:hypothetical protein
MHRISVPASHHTFAKAIPSEANTIQHHSCKALYTWQKSYQGVRRSRLAEVKDAASNRDFLHPRDTFGRK